MSTRFQTLDQLGWWLALSAARATRVMKPNASLKSRNLKLRLIASRSASKVQSLNSLSAASRPAVSSLGILVPLTGVPPACPLCRLFVSEGQTYAPDAATFERLADESVQRLPGPFRRHLAGVVFRIEEFAEEDVLRELGIDNAFDLTGLYTGRPIGEQSSMLSGELPAIIHIYRRTLLNKWAETGVSQEARVSHFPANALAHTLDLPPENIN